MDPGGGAGSVMTVYFRGGLSFCLSGSFSITIIDITRLDRVIQSRVLGSDELVILKAKGFVQSYKFYPQVCKLPIYLHSCRQRRRGWSCFAMHCVLRFIPF